MNNYIFSEKDFADLKYNMFSETEPRGLRKKLPSVKALDGREDADKLLKYVMLMYDKNSPAVRFWQDVAQRKRECAVLAGYDLKSDYKTLESVFDFTDFNLQEITIEFLKDQNNLVWAMIVSNEQTFYEYQKTIMSEVLAFDSDKEKMSAVIIKTKLMQDSDEIVERLTGYYAKVFGDGEEKRIATQSYTPESIARK